MYKNKLEKIWELIKLIKNDINLPVISDFLEWFYKKIKIHFEEYNREKLTPKKWETYLVDLWQNIWSELNKIRPCIVYSNYYVNWWNNIIIIPIKTYKTKLNKNIQVLIEKDNLNKLEVKSIASLFSIREISKKRIIRRIWILDKRILKIIDNKISKIFEIKQKIKNR